jgi:NAD(P)H-hydrate repair Nnr-like enzyme with NAD(P)H-hydrate dehydratase domain
MVARRAPSVMICEVHVYVAQTGEGRSEEAAAELEAACSSFEEAGQLVVDADQAQEDAVLARQVADRLSR